MQQVVTALTVEVLMDVLGNKDSTWLSQEVIKPKARCGEDSQTHYVSQAAGHLANARVVLEDIKAGNVQQQYLSSLVHILFHHEVERVRMI